LLADAVDHLIHNLLPAAADYAEAERSIQLRSHELFHLLNLLRPDVVIDRPTFERMAEPNPHINAAIAAARRAGPGWTTNAAESLRRAGRTPREQSMLAPNPDFGSVLTEFQGEPTDSRRVALIRQMGWGLRIQPASPAFRESVKVGEQILFAQGPTLVGDRDPRAEEFTLLLRAIDADKSGGSLGVAVLVALCGSLLGRNSRGGTIVVRSASLGGSARRRLNDLPDELWTKIDIEFYKDAADAVFKALIE
jgi:hypothetical protein